MYCLIGARYISGHKLLLKLIMLPNNCERNVLLETEKLPIAFFNLSLCVTFQCS